MDSKKKVTASGVWRAVYPVLLYEAVQFFVSVFYAAALLLPDLIKGTSWNRVQDTFLSRYMAGTVTIVLISAVIAFPLFGWMYYRDTKRRNFSRWKEMPTEGKLLWVVIGSGALALFANNIISLTQLIRISESYQETSEALNMGSIWLRMACVGFLAPAVEELLMRGLFYQRFRDMAGVRASMFFSALAFGIIHGNIVQGVYAFAVGLFFAWLMERYQRIIAPVLAHMSANLFVVLLGEGSVADLLFGTPAGFFGATLVSGLVFLCAFWMLRKEED